MNDCGFRFESTPFDVRVSSSAMTTLFEPGTPGIGEEVFLFISLFAARVTQTVQGENARKLTGKRRFRHSHWIVFKRGGGD